jgi:kynurenine formamidase
MTWRTCCTRTILAFPGRTFRQYLTTNYHQINRRHPDAGPAGLGHNSVNWIVEQVTATQQMGTHMDGLNHLQMGDRTYNGFLLADIIEDHGTSRLGVDTLPQVVTRGLLLDVAASRGGERLHPGDVITVADVEKALAVTGHDVRPGDAVFFHTGWGGLWGTDNERYAAGEPGPGLALAGWLADHRVALTGCDTWSFGPYPPEDHCAPFVVPQLLNVRHGVVVVENLRLADAARDRLGEFLLVISHAKLRGATGAWVAPLAVV